MSQLLRLTYVSRANFAVDRYRAGIQLDVARILVQSRRNNPRHRLVGALYFGDGCFFQCLEGPPDEVEALYLRLHDDPRHGQLQVLAREFVSSASFSRWSMKLVPNAKEVQSLMARHGRTTFDPYSFDPALQAAMVQLLVRGADAALPPQPDDAADSPSSGRHAGTAVNIALALGALGTLLGAVSLGLHLLG